MAHSNLPQLPQVDAVICDGIIRSSRFNDIYFSSENGLAETRHVFIQGTGLQNRLLEQNQLIIAETGFGYRFEFFGRGC